MSLVYRGASRCIVVPPTMLWKTQSTLSIPWLQRVATIAVHPLHGEGGINGQSAAHSCRCPGEEGGGVSRNTAKIGQNTPKMVKIGHKHYRITCPWPETRTNTLWHGHKRPLQSRDRLVTTNGLPTTCCTSIWPILDHCWAP